MQMKVITTATSCHVVVSISVNGHFLISLRDNDEDTVDLLPGVEYRFEWHAVAGNGDGNFSIDAEVAPINDGFPRFHLDKQLGSGERSDRLFLFTLKNL